MISNLSTEDREILSLCFTKGQKLFEKTLEKAFAKKSKLNLETKFEDYNIYNFLDIETIICPCQELLANELLNELVGNNRTTKIVNNSNKEEMIKDLHRTRLINQSFLKASKFEYRNRQVNEEQTESILKKVVEKHFEEYFRNDSINEALEVLKTTKIIPFVEEEMLAALDIKLILLFSDVERLHKETAQENMISAYFKSEFDFINTNLYEKTDPSEVEKEKNENILDIISRIIRESIFSESIDYYIRLTHNSQWESNFVEKEKNEIISKRITGKIIYSIEEKALSLVADGLMSEHFKLAFMLSHQNKHDYGNGNRLKEKSLKYINNPLARNKMTKCNKQGVQDNLENEIEPKNPSSKEKASKNRFSSQYHKIYIPKIISNTSFVDQSKHKSTAVLKATFNKPIVFNHDINDITKEFSIKSYKPIKKNNLTNSEYDSPKTKFQKYQSKFHGKQPRENDKYPIKIGQFVAEANSSYLEYKIDELSIKELSKQFIIDRIRYKENNVRLILPIRQESHYENTATRALQILCCLGAHCRLKSSSFTSATKYKQIDPIEPAVISYVENIPFKEAIRRYYEFNHIEGKNNLIN